jgi:polygalacturonase
MRVVWMGLALMAGRAVAQDTRAVTEPVIPKSCVVLQAAIASTMDSNGGRLRDEDENKLDTDRIQKALDSCGTGMAVELASAGGRNAFLTGPLELRSGVTLLVDKGVTLFASRDPKVYEVKLPDAKPDDPVKCGTSVPRPGQFGSEQTIAASAGLRRGGCRPLISITNVTNAAIMGEGTIDGRGYAKLLGHDYSWWEMARKAEPKDDIYFSTRLIVASHADGLVMYKITLHNSQNYHVSVGQTDGFTVWGVHLQTPVDKKLDARNTDGIDPGNSSNITVAHSWIDNGDDNIAVKANVLHMSVLDNHFYSGHGMSIGSEATGDAFLLVDGLTEDHTTSGIRIKSNVTRGGYDHDLTYRNICMRDVANPIAISPYYTNQTVEGFVDPGYKGTKIPDYKKIVLENITSETAGNVLIAGIDDAHRTEVWLDGVFIRGIKPDQVHLAFDDITVVNVAHATVKGINFSIKQGPNVTVNFTDKYPLDVDNPSYTHQFADCKFVPMQ